MGVLNCTPDSFSDGDVQHTPHRLIQKAKLMLQAGADIIDIGGESTRPGALPIDLDEELARVIPVIEGLQGLCPISIDTTKAEVMRQAVAAGASMINDVSALSMDEASLAVAASSGADVCLMHMQGRPQTMQENPAYDDVLLQVIAYFEQRIAACLDAGISREALVLDPGIGFGKRLEDNLTLIANLAYIKATLGLPVLLGSSRKSFLGLMTGSDVEHREVETAATSAIGIFCGADIIRIHDCEFQKKAAIVASYCADAKRSWT